MKVGDRVLVNVPIGAPVQGVVHGFSKVGIGNVINVRLDAPHAPSWGARVQSFHPARVTVVSAIDLLGALAP